MRILDFDAARKAILNGSIIVYPTETFFALGGQALYSPAVTAVYRAKRRQHTLPLPVILGSIAQLEDVAETPPEALFALAKHFWPGPLSIVCRAAPNVPALLTGSTGHIAVRVTAHPAARDLCLECGPLCASSANISGRMPASHLDELDPELLTHACGVFNAPPAPTGALPSTIVEIRDKRDLVILRPGAVDPDQLRENGWNVSPE